MKYLFYLIIFCLIFIHYQSTTLKFKDGDNVKITTKVLSEPLIFNNQQYLKIENLKVYLPKYPRIDYGDKVVITGIVDDNKLKKSKIEKIETDDRGVLFDFRFRIINFYRKILPEPYSSLVAGITLGSKQMPEAFWNKLKETGTAHIVVASGTNVSLLSSMLILSLTHFIKRKFAVFITIAVIISYIVLSGFDAPIIRASIMGIILLFGQLTGRVTDTWRILVYTFITMLLFKPEWVNDLGFILSFTATASLLLFQKRIDNYFKYLPNVLREGFTTSIAAQIGVGPIIYATFGQFNLLSPIINALVLWTVPYIMAAGMIAAVLSQLIPQISVLILFVIFPMLWWFEKVISIFN